MSMMVRLTQPGAVDTVAPVTDGRANLALAREALIRAVTETASSVPDREWLTVMLTCLGADGSPEPVAVAALGLVVRSCPAAAPGVLNEVLPALLAYRDAREALAVAEAGTDLEIRVMLLCEQN